MADATLLGVASQRVRRQGCLPSTNASSPGQWRGCGTTLPARMRLHAPFVSPVACINFPKLNAARRGLIVLRNKSGSAGDSFHARFAATTAAMA